MMSNFLDLFCDFFYVVCDFLYFYHNVVIFNNFLELFLNSNFKFKKKKQGIKQNYLGLFGFLAYFGSSSKLLVPIAQFGKMIVE